MRIFRMFTAVALIASVSTGAVSAKSLRNAGAPAEFPPASYKAKQYVDSKGCVFIRAGFSNNVTWVPRVSRSRKQVCRQSPTFAKAPTPKAPVVANVAPVAKIPVVRPAPKRVVRSAPKRVVRAAAKPVVIAAPKRAIRKPVRVAAPVRKPRAVVRRTVRTPVVVAPKTVAYRASTRCQGTATSGRRFVNRSGMTVRCGPQVESPTGGYVNAAPIARMPRSQNRRLVAPKPTRAVVNATRTPARTQVRSNQRVVMIAPLTTAPAGYVNAWKDDRQNPNRARGTAAGKAQMEMVWTNTVPRRLVAVSTSQDTRRRVVIRK